MCTFTSSSATIYSDPRVGLMCALSFLCDLIVFLLKIHMAIEILKCTHPLQMLEIGGVLDEWVEDIRYGSCRTHLP